MRIVPARAASDWAAQRLLPAFEPPRSLDIYDVRHAPFDVQLSAATLTGLVNRHQPRVYLLSNDDADELLRALLAHIPLHQHAVPAEQALGELLATYREVVKGMVIYDPDMIDSVNVATTLAGLRDAVVVSPQQAGRLQQAPYNLPVLADLRVYAWSNRLQAYRWAVRNLLGQSSRRLVAGMKPQIASGLRSYLVATRAFVYWLDSHRALPDPRNGWTTERHLMRRILRSFAPGTPHLGWFVDEPRGVGLASHYALPVLPSDYFYNMEVWTAAPGSPGSPDAHEGHPYISSGPTTRVYVSFTISDGDNLQFNQHSMYHLWQDPARGSVPLGWTFSPVLLEAAPALAAYYALAASPNDALIAGPSGAGYILPSKWPRSQLSPYLRLTGTLMQRVGLQSVEILDTLSTKFFPHRSWQAVYARELARYGVRGLMLGDAYKRTGWSVVEGVPLIRNLGLVNSVEMALKLIRDNTPAQVKRAQYMNIYMHAWTTMPSDVKQIVEALDSRYEVVTPTTLLAMIAMEV